MAEFDEWFARLTGNPPHPYQKRLAMDAEWPSVASIPTGAGKTAAAVLAWLWKRGHGSSAQKNATGRRLVFCLPMRVLVEQTLRVVKSWLEKDGSAQSIGLHVLMGGEDASDWAMWPEKDAILIGTQDMLLSRALNRGYGASRARWPQEFGLLHNDCLWVLDEVQLMGVGLSTSAQLEAFRKEKSFGACQTLWMSATVKPDWIATVDHPKPSSLFTLSDAEVNNKSGHLGRLLHAPKKLLPLGVERSGKTIAERVLCLHNDQARPELTLVVCNTIKHAVDVFDSLVKAKKKSEKPELVLLHSRFRPVDRARVLEKVLSPVPAGGRIVVSTQVIEAGVDISSSLLITDLAPWASLVQRLGRLNRKGEYAESNAYWVDVPEKHVAPYSVEELMQAREKIVAVEKQGGQVSPAALPGVEGTSAIGHVLRRREMVELFDTTPDLAGHDIDVARYIREGDDLDVSVFWREITPGQRRPENQPAPRREELCPVSVGDFRKWLEGTDNETRAWEWDFLDSRWIKARPNDVYPGKVFLLGCTAGGYTPETGWSATSRAVVPVITDGMERVESQQPEGNDDDALSEVNAWQTIGQHTDEVVARLESVLVQLEHISAQKTEMLNAARWHDLGKAHAEFQGKISAQARETAGKLGTLLAKAPSSAWNRSTKQQRRHFRHELASAIAVLENGLSDLVAYLVASHHGKVRLSIRALPEENGPSNPNTRYARGIWEGDKLPACDLGGGVRSPETHLTLASMEMGLDEKGNPSWADRMLALRDTLGIFKLAYLEAVLRAADQQASAQKEAGR